MRSRYFVRSNVLPFAGVAALALASEIACAQESPAEPEAKRSGLMLVETTQPAWHLQRRNEGADAHPLLNAITRNLEKSGATAELSCIAEQSKPGVERRASSSGAERSVVRAAQKAIKNLLVDATEMEARLDALFGSVEFKSPAPHVSSSEPHLQYGLGLSRLLPRLELRRAIGEGSMNLSVNTIGQVDFDLRTGNGARGWLHGAYNPRSSDFSFRYQIRF